MCKQCNMRIGKLLRFYRAQCGTSLRSLAAEIGVEFTMLSRFERGRTINQRSWVAIFMWLLGEDGTKTTTKNKR